MEVSVTNTTSMPPERLASMTIEQIAATEKVSRKRAYALKRAATIASAPEVPQNQRERLLAVLYQNPDIRNSDELLPAVQATGYSIDGHDVVKVMWSLQKTGHVKFRERQPHRGLYGIHLTTRGLRDAENIISANIPGEEDLQLSDPIEPPEAFTGDHAVFTIPVSTGEEVVIFDPLANVNRVIPVSAEIVGDVEVTVGEPSKPWINGMGGWPKFRDIKERAKKAEKLRAAAQLLDEAGETDTALAILGKTEFTNLEDEVIAILEWFKELP